ncbi:MAG: hypothetical protein WCI88_16150 [Chloroflexota bacterium]
MGAIAGRIEKLSTIQYVYALWLLSFCIPLFISSPQIITGTLINCFLYLAADRLSNKDIIPIIMLPSLGAISHGILFGPQTIFLYYFIPFIWAGNYALVWVFSKFLSLPYLFRVTLSAFLKFLLLQSFAYLCFQIGIVPQIFVSSMGYIQFITAIAGGLLAFGFTKYLDYD